MDYQALSTLIKTHPTWQTETDQVLADWCNEETVTKTHATLSTGTVFAVIAANIADFNALTESEKQTVRDILYIHSGEGIPTAAGSPARTLLQDIFESTATLAALGDAVSYEVSRAANVGIAKTVSADHVAYARTL